MSDQDLEELVTLLEEKRNILSSLNLDDNADLYGGTFESNEVEIESYNKFIAILVAGKIATENFNSFCRGDLVLSIKSPASDSK